MALIWCMSPLFKQVNSRGKIKRVVNETKYFCYCPHIHFYVGIMFFFLKNESKVKRAFFSNNLSIQGHTCTPSAFINSRVLLHFLHSAQIGFQSHYVKYPLHNNFLLVNKPARRNPFSNGKISSEHVELRTISFAQRSLVF